MRGSPLRLVVAAVVAFAACNRSLEVPEPPGAPGAGTLQATVLYQEPGREGELPAVGASVELLGTSVRVDVTESNGHFTLTPITTRSGNVLIRFKAGNTELRRLISLDAIGAGPGRDISLGPVLLGGNAAVKGFVTLEDFPGATSGLMGTSIFVPEGPFIGYSANDGSFLLDQLPEGRVTLTFFRQGYESGSVQLTLAAGEVFKLNTVVLKRAAQTGDSRVTGTVSLEGVTDFSGVVVSFSGIGVTATSSASGAWELPARISPGLYAVGFSKSGFQTAVKNNVLVEGDVTVVPPVTLISGQTTNPVLDAGAPPDAGMPGGGAGGGGGSGGGGGEGGGAAGGSAGGAAGGSAGGAAGGSAGGAAGGAPDAGNRPTAIVEPLPNYVDAGQPYVLDGSGSMGMGPFVYHWSQDAGPTVTVPNNHTLSAATPSVVMPGSVSFLKMALVVTDMNGIDSAPADFTVRVARGLPVAAISPLPPMTIYAGQIVNAGSTGSNDTANGTGITSYEWSVLPAGTGITLAPQGDGSTVQLTMPATVTTAQLVSLRLVVVNGLGMRSNAASAQFTLTNMSAPTWTLTTGGVQTVAGGSVATLSATATAPGGGVTFSYQWSPAAITDAGTSNFQLVDPAVQNAQFLAPIISGPNFPLTFDVTATVTSGGLTPAQRTGQQVVIVQDQRQPQIIGTSVLPGFTGSPFGAWVDFDEDMRGLTSIGFASQGSPAAPSQRLSYAAGLRRARIEVLGFAPPGATMRINAGGQCRDFSPVGGNTGNPIQQQTFDYVSTFRYPAPVAAPDSTTEPMPALVPVSNALGDVSVYLVGRRDSNAVFFNLLALNPNGLAALVQDTTAPVIALTSGKRSSPNYVMAGGLPYVLLQQADFDGNAGIAVVRKATGWVRIANPPGGLFATDTALASVWVESGTVRFATYDATLDTWSSPTTIVTNATDYPSTSGSNAAVWGMSTGTGRLLVQTRNAAGDLRPYLSTTNGASWTATSDGINAGGIPFKQVRVMKEGDTSGFGATGALQTNGSLRFQVLGGMGGFGTYTGVSEFDIVSDNELQWMATIESGQLVVQTRRSTGQVVPGPHASAPTSMNFDPACVASSPAIVRQGEFVAVAWQERCGGTGPYKMYVRYVR